MTIRRNVALVVVDAAGRILIGERSDIAGAWQLPQGGVEPDEDIEAAGWRELSEETGLGPDMATLVGRAGPFTYHLPKGAASKRGFAGQEQTYLFFRLARDGVTVRPNEEFRAFRWAGRAEVLALAVDFKRPCYEAAFRAFFGEASC